MKEFQCPCPGRRLLHVNCSQLEQHSIEDAIQVVLELGYTPEFRYQANQGKVNLYIVLKDQPIELADDGDEWESIVVRLLPDSLAVRDTRWPASVALPTAAPVAA
jgi:hypothetical protein